MGLTPHRKRRELRQGRRGGATSAFRAPSQAVLTLGAESPGGVLRVVVSVVGAADLARGEVEPRSSARMGLRVLLAVGPNGGARRRLLRSVTSAGGRSARRSQRRVLASD